MNDAIAALNVIHEPRHERFVLPGADSASAGIVVEWRTWGGMWMWHVLTHSSRSETYQHVWNSENGLDVRHFDWDSQEVPAPDVSA